jgi:Dyp-type peroxidase family
VIQEEVLELEDIQGNIVAGFNKPFMTLLSLRVQDPIAARGWLRDLAVEITPASSSLDAKLMFRTLRRLGVADALVGPAAVNIAIGASFLRTLGFTPEDLKDTSFVAGLEAQSPFLSDPTNGARGAPERWVVGNSANPLDVLLIVGSEDRAVVAAKVAALHSDAEARGLRAVLIDEGRKRPEQPGHEHFGFNDGISQPGIRGRKSAAASDFFEDRLIAANDPINTIPGGPEFSAAGQPLIWPGQFVFGYLTQDSALQRASAAAIPVPSWARNGSLLVFRRLYQDVGAFRAFIAAESGKTGMSADELGARLVGRWASGASPVAFPSADPGEPIGDNKELNNSFLYQQSYGPITLRSGTVVPRADHDLFGKHCPYAAHLRKVNPRDGLTDERSSAKTLTHRILRRGIPYGDSFDAGDPGADRGLLFVSYQTSIVDQFEFLTTDWMNRPDRPQSGGQDMIVGQNKEGRTRSAEVPDRAGGTHTVTSMTDFVVPTGGAYLFAPSRSFLKSLP